MLHADLVCPQHRAPAPKDWNRIWGDEDVSPGELCPVAPDQGRCRRVDFEGGLGVNVEAMGIQRSEVNHQVELQKSDLSGMNNRSMGYSITDLLIIKSE